MNYKFVPISENDIEMLRHIRNNCRLYMTNNNEYIHRDQQVAWFENLDTEKYKVFLFKIPHSGIYHPIGYGIVKLDPDCALLTGGIVTGYRGNGYGRKLFEELIGCGLQYRKNIRLDVLKTNERAASLYTSLGFVATGGEDVISMELR